MRLPDAVIAHLHRQLVSLVRKETMVLAVHAGRPWACGPIPARHFRRRRYNGGKEEVAPLLQKQEGWRHTGQWRKQLHREGKRIMNISGRCRRVRFEVAA